jgi:hypothetical protein
MSLRNNVEEMTKQLRTANASIADKESKLKAMAGLAAQDQKFKHTQEQLKRVILALSIPIVYTIPHAHSPFYMTLCSYQRQWAY